MIPIGSLVLQFSYALLAIAALMARGAARLFIALAAATVLIHSLVWSHDLTMLAWAGVILACCLFVLVRDMIVDRTVRFSAEEEGMLGGFLAGMPRHVARHLIDGGVWLNGTVGDEITREGQPVQRVVYLASGEALVMSDARQVATCRAGDLIGEASILTGEAATATVVLAGPSRFWCMPADALRAHLETDAELRTMIERAFARAVRTKLHASNRTIAAAGGVA